MSVATSCLDCLVLIFSILCNIFKVLCVQVHEIFCKTGIEIKSMIIKPKLAKVCAYICKYKYTTYYNKNHYQNYLNQVLKCYKMAESPVLE